MNTLVSTKKEGKKKKKNLRRFQTTAKLSSLAVINPMPSESVVACCGVVEEPIIDKYVT